MDLPAFAVTWDYRCPFARNAHEHLVAALEAGAPWDVTFSPFSLSQIHVHEDAPPVWDDPTKAPDLQAMLVGLVVRDRFDEKFLAVHRALFTARHDEGRDLRERNVLHSILEDHGVPAAEVVAEIDKGWPLEEFRAAHEESVKTHQVFGVPTFIVGNGAAFVRLMTRPHGDGALGRATIEGVLALMVERPEINEFKYTSIDR
jgi:hypothetical protein